MTERPVPWKAGRSWAGREIVERKPRAWAVASAFLGLRQWSVVVVSMWCSVMNM